jgi:hypothetical protein
MYTHVLCWVRPCSDGSLTMRAIRSTKCPVAFVGAAGALLVLVTAVHVFMVPILPSSLDYFGARSSASHPRNASLGVGVVDSRLREHFPSDSHGAVVFRGAPWKAEVGRWLAGCHANSSSFNITEVCSYRYPCSLGFFDLACFELNLGFSFTTGYRCKALRERLQWKWCVQL